MLACFYSSFACASLCEDHQQALLVIGESKGCCLAKMWLFEKTYDWQQVGSKIDVVVGCNGFAWSHGLHGSCPEGEETRTEGSKTTPLGIYPIDSVFGLNPLEECEPYNLPYIHFNSSVFAVDDVKSQYYNMIVDANVVEKDWQSAEDVSQISFYKYGAVVGFNTQPIDKEAGSAIFLHVWKAPVIPTAGCTAMSEANMIQVIKWLKRDANPVLVQLTRADYLKYKKSWNLPDISID